MTLQKNFRYYDTFRFLKVPLAFWEEDIYSDLTLAEIILYAHMYNRLELSRKNGWIDDTDQPYIYFTIAEIMHILRCGKEKAIKAKKKLKTTGLIAYNKGRRGDPDRIHVLPLFISRSVSYETRSENQTSKVAKNRPDKYVKSDPNKTDNIKTEDIKNNLSGKDGCNNIHEAIEEIIKESIEYNILSERGYDMNTIDSYIAIMVSAACSTSGIVKIGGELVPTSMVRSRFEKYTFEDIVYVLDCMSRNTSAISNITGYMLKTLYDAPVTRKIFYAALVRHDMPEFVSSVGTGGGVY